MSETKENKITVNFVIEQKAKIEKLIKRAKMDLEFLRENIKNIETPIERRTESQQEEPKTIAKIELLRKALVRIEYNNYGKCRGCGEEIQTNRLKALPTTEHCTKCAK